MRGGLLGDEVEGLVIIVDLIEFEDVGMIELFEY